MYKNERGYLEGMECTPPALPRVAFVTQQPRLYAFEEHKSRCLVNSIQIRYSYTSYDSVAAGLKCSRRRNLKWMTQMTFWLWCERSLSLLSRLRYIYIEIEVLWLRAQKQNLRIRNTSCSWLGFSLPKYITLSCVIVCNSTVMFLRICITDINKDIYYYYIRF